jgi:hypothetical protein
VTDDPELEDDSERLAEVLGNVLLLSANESIVADQLEALSIFDPMPATLDLTKGSALESKLRRLSTALGGPPIVIFTKEGEPPPQFDTYARAATAEAIDAFMLARSSICRTHMYRIGNMLIKERPELIDLPQDPNVRRVIINKVEANFWEHTETSYIRLASFWDRVGQLLDFVFFNIRQYERDGFSAVMDRISVNFLRMNQTNVLSATWARLRGFQISEKPDGLKWLLRRRNLLVHSLHLRPLRQNEADNPIFTSAYNHLDQAARDKLRQGTAEQELSVLHQHLSAAATLFADAVEVALTESPVANQF